MPERSVLKDNHATFDSLRALIMASGRYASLPALILYIVILLSGSRVGFNCRLWYCMGVGIYIRRRHILCK